ncbi:MAG TPA: response regulator [bacterium]|nr:response regulator [bacterium]HOL48435.1 response regulator [bacterium]HPQ18677.1 response regulator [bacterium]
MKGINLNKNLIMIVDDSKFAREAYSMELEKKGYNVITAPDAETAFAIAKKEKPMYIFCDFHMEGLNGLDLCKMIREDDELKDAIFVIITDKEVTEQQQAIDFHDLPDSWINKHIGIDEFIATMEKWIKMSRKV